MTFASLHSSNYMPEDAGVSAESIAAARAVLEADALIADPTLDTAPGSPFGDLFLTPAARQLARLAEAKRRFSSDLTMQNVAAGEVYDCDFVAAFLADLAITPATDSLSFGMVTLTFNPSTVVMVGGAVELNAGMRFLFGSNSVFTIRTLSTDRIRLVSPEYTGAYTPNTYRMHYMPTGTLEVLLPVWGSLVDTVNAGASGQVEEIVPGLAAVTAAMTFLEGRPASSVPQLAQRALKTVYASTPTTRGGAVSFVLNHFPDVRECSAVLSGDWELTRDGTNAFGLPAGGNLDLYVAGTPLTLTVRMACTVLAGEQHAVGRIPYDGAVLSVQSVTPVEYIQPHAAPTRDNGYYFVSSTAAPTRGSLGQVAGSSLERLDLVLTLPYVDAAPVYAVRNGEVLVDVVMTVDPTVDAVARAIRATGTPAGVDVLVKAFKQANLEKLTISYVRRPGAQVNIGKARREILAAYDGLAYPRTLGASEATDALLYAGALQVSNFVPSVLLREVASYFMPVGGSLTAGVAANPGASLVPAIPVTAELLSQVTYEWYDEASEISYGPRNIMFNLTAEALEVVDAIR